VKRIFAPDCYMKFTVFFRPSYPKQVNSIKNFEDVGLAQTLLKKHSSVLQKLSIYKLFSIKVCCPQTPATNVVLRINHLHWSFIFILQINYLILFLLLNKTSLFQVQRKLFLKLFWIVFLYCTLILCN